MTTTRYRDNTPAVSIAYNRMGQKLSAGNSASATAYGYDANLRLVSETVTGPVNRVLQRSYDENGRPNGITVTTGINPSINIEHAVGYGYDNAGRLGAVTIGTDAPSAANTFSYGYLPKSVGLIETIWGPVLTGTQPVTTVTNIWEDHRDVLQTKQNVFNGNSVSQYKYVVNNLGQRTSVEHSGSAFTSGSYALGNTFNLYEYDTMGQLTSAKRYSGGTLSAPQDPVNNQQYGFNFDNIGNRLTATDGMTSGTYGVNAVNQYTVIQSGTASLAEPTYDADGNLTNDNGTVGKQYYWDGENRLVSVTSGSMTINYGYDAQSRRIEKKVINGDQVTSDTGFIYDGWNVVAEYDILTGNLAATNTWGLDLSGSPQGAGGVGGLLARNTGGVIYVYTYDGNGNISEVLSATEQVAHYEYGPFGEPLGATGIMAAQNPFRFSTKYTDDETGLLYYGYRYYNPSTGRWINRDPIKEALI